MLPKVSAALARFVTPIQTHTSGHSGREAFTRTQPKKDRRPSGGREGMERKSGGERQPLPEQALRPQGTPLEDPSTAGAQGDSAQKIAFGAAFLQLLASLKSKRATLIRWLGVRHYQSGLRSQKRSGRFSKGAMLDVKVD